jgi:hypothetical protein
MIKSYSANRINYVNVKYLSFFLINIKRKTRKLFSLIFNTYRNCWVISSFRLPHAYNLHLSLWTISTTIIIIIITEKESEHVYTPEQCSSSTLYVFNIWSKERVTNILFLFLFLLFWSPFSWLMFKFFLLLLLLLSYIHSYVYLH